ncbi:hypothetical protein LTR22_027456 [Elasticomyces elasticus]|nr:hypothetical protein LTR22_027456 [Elasticomyces elasticus]
MKDRKSHRMDEDARNIKMQKAKNPTFKLQRPTRPPLRDVTNHHPVTPAATPALKRKQPEPERPKDVYSLVEDYRDQHQHHQHACHIPIHPPQPGSTSPDLDDDEDRQSVSSDELPPLKRYRTHLHSAPSEDLTAPTQHTPQVSHDDQQSELDDEDKQSVTDSIKSDSSTMSIRERRKQKTPRQRYDANKGPTQYVHPPQEGRLTKPVTRGAQTGARMIANEELKYPEDTHEAVDWSFLNDISDTGNGDLNDLDEDEEDNEYDAAMERALEEEEEGLPDDEPDLIEGEVFDLLEHEDDLKLDSILRAEEKGSDDGANLPTHPPSVPKKNKGVRTRQDNDQYLRRAFEAEPKRYIRRMQETLRMGPEPTTRLPSVDREANARRFKERLATMLLALSNVIREDFRTQAMAVSVKAALMSGGVDKVLAAVLPGFREEAVDVLGAEIVTPATLLEIPRVDDPKAYTDWGLYIDVLWDPTATQPPTDPVMTSCFHTYCKGCITGVERPAAGEGHDGARCAECGDAYTSVKPCEDQEAVDRRTRYPETHPTPVAQKGQGAYRLYGGTGAALIGLLRRLMGYVRLLENRPKTEGLHTYKMLEPGAQANFRLVWGSNKDCSPTLPCLGEGVTMLFIGSVFSTSFEPKGRWHNAAVNEVFLLHGPRDFLSGVGFGLNRAWAMKQGAGIKSKRSGCVYCPRGDIMVGYGRGASVPEKYGIVWSEGGMRLAHKNCIPAHAKGRRRQDAGYYQPLKDKCHSCLKSTQDGHIRYCDGKPGQPCSKCTKQKQWDHNASRTEVTERSYAICCYFPLQGETKPDPKTCAKCGKVGHAAKSCGTVDPIILASRETRKIRLAIKEAYPELMSDVKRLDQIKVSHYEYEADGNGGYIVEHVGPDKKRRNRWSGGKVTSKGRRG